MQPLHKDRWQSTGGQYDTVWQGAGKTNLSNLELSLLTTVITEHRPQRVLDIGCGTGRIIHTYASQPSIEEIYGVDAAPSMVAHCTHRFANERKVRDIICEDSEAHIPFSGIQFDMISAIRVLKYNSSWRTMLKNLNNRLKPNGILVCTMPNIRSVTALWPGKVKYTTPKKFNAVLEEAGFHVLDMRGYSKLPDKLHTHATSPISATLLSRAESFLQETLGPTFATRILFATCQKI